MNRGDEQAIQEVLQAEHAWTEAHRQLDIDTIRALMAEDYTIIRSDGSVVGKEEALASYRDDAREWEYANSDEHIVRLYGNSAVMIGRWVAKGTNNGQPFDYSARFLSVYVRGERGWQIVAEQSTPMDTSSGEG